MKLNEKFLGNKKIVANSNRKYDAFISYKHSELDNTIASNLQRLLENVKLPKENLPENVKDKIERIFLDDGELSSSADFKEIIQEAIRNSEWLIVICSKETPNSEWVNLEIQTFLETHDRDHILAVLTDGEPNLSFPFELRENSSHLEVLAADVRESTIKKAVKKLKGDAYLRIAAPILGVSFDSLKQRNYSYRLKLFIRSLIVIISVISMFLGYILYQSTKLKEEYENTLLNESQYLVEQARILSDNHNQIGAVEVLLEALPGKKNADRPLLLEGEYELSKNLNAYVSPFGTTHYEATSTIEIEYGAERYLSEKDEYLVVDNSDQLIVYETDSMKEIYSKKGLTDALVLVNNTQYIFLDSKENTMMVECFDYVQKKTVWQTTIQDTSTILSKDYMYVVDDVLYCASSKKIVKIDVGKGDVLEEYAIPTTENSYNGNILLANKKGDVAYTVGEKFYFLNGESKKIQKIEYDSKYIDSFSMNDTYIFMLGIDEDYGYGKYSFYKYSIEEDSLEKLEYTVHSSVVYMWGTSYNTVHLDSFQDTSVVQFVYGNMVYVFDQKKNSLLQELVVENEIVKCIFEKEQIGILTTAGKYYSFHNYLRKDVYPDYAKVFVDDVVDILSNTNTDYYVVSNNEKKVGLIVMKYQNDYTDMNYESLVSLAKKDYSDNLSLENDRYLCFYLNNSVRVYDLVTKKECIFELESEYTLHKLGFVQEDNSLYYYKNNELIQLNFSTNKKEVISLEQKGMNIQDIVFIDSQLYLVKTKEKEVSYEDNNIVSYLEQLIVSRWSSEKEQVLWTYDFEISDTAEGYSGKQDDNGQIINLICYKGSTERYERNSFCINKNSNRASLLLQDTDSVGKKTLLYIDLKSGNLSRVRMNQEQEGYLSLIKNVMDQNGKYILSSYKNSNTYFIDYYNQKGTVQTFEYDSRIAYYGFLDNENFVVITEGILHEYDKNGKEIFSYDLEYDSYVEQADLKAIKDTLYLLRMDNTTYILCLKDNTLQPISKIENCIAYQKETDSFMVYAIKDSCYEIGSFKRYELNDLVHMGENLIDHNSNKLE